MAPETVNLKDPSESELQAAIKQALDSQENVTIRVSFGEEEREINIKQARPTED